MSELGLQQARALLRERGVAFTEYPVFNDFHGTALIFETEELAWAAYDLLVLVGTGPRIWDSEGRFAIVYYS